MKIFFLLIALISFNVQAGQNVRVEFDLNVQAGFTQKTRFIFSVDNSGSMSQHQQSLMGTVSAALQPLIDVQLPFEVFVLNTDSFETKFITSTDSNDPNSIQTVQDFILNSGTNGGPDERSMESFLAVADQINSEASYLNFIILSDEPDFSRSTLDDFYGKLVEVNDGRSDLVNLYAVTYDETVGCKNANGGTNGGTEYDVMIAKVGNNSKKAQMCDPAVISILMDEIGQNSATATKSQDPKPVFMPFKSIQLGMTPVFDTLVVKYGNQTFAKGSLPDGYVYYQTENKILFGDSVELKYQPKGTKLTIEYVSEDDVVSETADVAAILELH